MAFKLKRYLEVRRKTAQAHSGSTISAKALLRKLDKDTLNISRIKPLKGNDNGTKDNTKK